MNQGVTSIWDPPRPLGRVFPIKTELVSFGPVKILTSPSKDSHTRWMTTLDVVSSAPLHRHRLAGPASASPRGIVRVTSVHSVDYTWHTSDSGRWSGPWHF